MLSFNNLVLFIFKAFTNINQRRTEMFLLLGTVQPLVWYKACIVQNEGIHDGMMISQCRIAVL